MPLRVFSMFQYLTGWDGIEARENDYLTLMVVKAVKGRPPGGNPSRSSLKGLPIHSGPGGPNPLLKCGRLGRRIGCSMRPPISKQ